MAVKEQTVPAILIIIIALQEYLNRTGFKEKINGTSLFKKIYGDRDEGQLTQDDIKEIINEQGIDEILKSIRTAEKETGHRISVDYLIYLTGYYAIIGTNRSNQPPQQEEPKEDSPEIQDCESWRPPQKKIS